MVARGKRRSVTVGSLQLSIEAGDVEHGIEPFGPALRRSNVPRRLLENLTSVRTEKGFKKKLGRGWVEEQLLNEMAVRGETGVNRLRDEAAALAPLLGMERQQQQLNKMVSAILRTHPVDGVLTTRAGFAQAMGKPFDRQRLDRFSALSSYLNKLDFK